LTGNCHDDALHDSAWFLAGLVAAGHVKLEFRYGPLVSRRCL
jgi:hypothetical protein